MRLSRLGGPLVVIAASALAAGQNGLVGKRQYPQFRVLSGLPGGGFGVMPDGSTGNTGAAALATPIGYTLGSGSYAAGFFNTSDDDDPFRLDSLNLEGHDVAVSHTNATAYYMGGVSFLGCRLTLANMVLSTKFDNVFNVQFSPPPLVRKLGIAVGVQDTAGSGGASGPLDFKDKLSSRSVYGVGTYEVAKGTYVSLGTGDRRFKGAFGNASVGITPRLRALAEYDGFNFNAGLIYDTGKALRFFSSKLRPDASFFLGAVRGQYATLGVSFTL